MVTEVSYHDLALEASSLHLYQDCLGTGKNIYTVQLMKYHSLTQGQLINKQITIDISFLHYKLLNYDKR